MVFAEANDLASRLKREFTDEESAWVEELLADATAYLQDQIGQLIYPRQTVTFEDWPSAGWVDLPQWPVVSVDAVERDGVAVEFERRPGRVRVREDRAVDVTFTFGYSEPPRVLKSLCVALVSKQLTLVEAGLGLSIGGLSSVALDDFKIAFANGGEGTGLTLPKLTIDGLRQSFGRGTVTQVETVT